MEIKLRKGTIKEVIEVNKSIPEFLVHFSEEHFKNHLLGKKHLIAIATVNDVPAGFSICYLNKYNNWIEIWVAGVSSNYRKMGIITKIFDYQEVWVRKNGVTRLIADVNQRNKEMIVIHLKRGFFISGFKFDKHIKTSKVFLEKQLD